MNPPFDTSETVIAHLRTPLLGEGPSGCGALRRALLQRHGRAVALGIALRHIRTAPTEQRLLAMIEEILVHHVGVEAFAVLDGDPEAPRLLVSRGIAPGDMAQAPMTKIPLGAGDWMLGALYIYRLVARKDCLDLFDHDLLAALGPQIAVALHSARLDAVRPTVRPPRTPHPEEA